MTEGPAELFARHVSPDDKLVWIVNRYLGGDGTVDFAFGFEDLAWHAHPDWLKAEGLTREQVALQVTDDVLSDRHIIKTMTDGDWMQRSLLDRIETEVDFLTNSERVSLRFWGGRIVSFEELIDGTVIYKPFNN